MLAAYFGQTKCVRYLHAVGSCVNQRDEQGRTAIMMAALGGQLVCLQFLLDSGGDVNARDEKVTAPHCIGQ